MPLNTVTSTTISKMLKNKHIRVSGTELEFLDALCDQSKPLTTEEISKTFNMNKELVESVVGDLETKQFVRINSPISVTPRGRKLIRLVRIIAKDVDPLIMQDTYLRILAQNSRSFVQ